MLGVYLCAWSQRLVSGLITVAMSEDTESGLGVLQLVKMHAAGQISLERVEFIVTQAKTPELTS